MNTPKNRELLSFASLFSQKYQDEVVMNNDQSDKDEFQPWGIFLLEGKCVSAYFPRTGKCRN